MNLMKFKRRFILKRSHDFESHKKEKNSRRIKLSMTLRNHQMNEEM